jgi:hypothetical protein
VRVQKSQLFQAIVSHGRRRGEPQPLLPLAAQKSPGRLITARPLEMALASGWELKVFLFDLEVQQHQSTVST